MNSGSWRKNLFAVVISEFITLVGFNFATPFLPLFIKDLGGFTDTEAALWTGVAMGGSGIALFFTAPLWGMLADRWRKKPMLLRAQFGAGIVTILISFAPNIAVVVILRILMGILSGSLGAASAMVANITPREKMPLAMGLIMVAMFSSQTVGPLLGGYMADTLGYQASFWITGVLLCLSGFMVLFLVKENVDDKGPKRTNSLRDVWQLATSGRMLPLLIAMCAVWIGPQMISPVIPLFIHEIDPFGHTATESGLAFCFLGGAAAVSSLLAGRLARRFSLKVILVFCCLGAGVFYLPPIWAQSVFQLSFLLAFTGLTTGATVTATNSLMGLLAPPDKIGITFGIAQSANALGYSMGPLIGGTLVAALGFRPVFGVTAALFIVVGFYVLKSLKVESNETNSPVPR